MKHALLLQLLARLTAAPGRLEVLDTHAGAGVYDLEREAARKSGEAQAGTLRLMADETAPAVFEPLKAAVRRLNPQGGLRFYPGSPWLILHALRAADGYLGCELRADDHASLAGVVRDAPKGVSARARRSGGFAAVAEFVGRPGARRLILIDPPFERGDDYRNLVQAVRRGLRVKPRPCFAVWIPLKDLETFDAYLRDLEAAGAGPLLVAQARLRPLDDPMRMNGCAVVLAGCPDLSAEAEAVCGWVAQRLGDPGAEARVERL